MYKAMIFTILIATFGSAFAENRNETAEESKYTPYQVPAPNGIAINLDSMEKNINKNNKNAANKSACWTCNCHYIPGTMIYQCDTCCN